MVSRVGSKSPSGSRMARLSSSISIGRCDRDDCSSATVEPSLENSTLLDYKHCTTIEFISEFLVIHKINYLKINDSKIIFLYKVKNKGPNIFVSNSNILMTFNKIKNIFCNSI